jgi:hypothetical protein
MFLDNLIVLYEKQLSTKERKEIITTAIFCEL